FKLGLDVELRNVAVAIQCERGPIGPAQKLSLQQLIGWGKQKVAQGHAVYTAYECCGFGYTLHEQLVDAGGTSFLTTPMRSNLERRRKNDRMDARLAAAGKWVRIAARCSASGRGQLQPVMERIRWGKANLDRWRREIEALVKEQASPVGLGALTGPLIEGQVCDGQRVSHRKA